MKILKQELKFNKRIQGFALAVAFVAAQLLITLHHANTPHSIIDTDDAFSIECGVCLVSADVYDTAPGTKFISFLQDGYQPPALGFDTLANARYFRPQLPRAPPVIT